eukprot:COSAG05_NODE_3311_length_2158_cov_0.880525_1_plen_362_part_10
MCGRKKTARICATFKPIECGALCKDKQAFSAKLEGRNGVPPREYLFKTMRLTSTSGSYSTLMRARCRTLGMKPVCEHPNYCRNDKQSLYLGQQNHISYRPHRRNNNWMPGGFSKIQAKWDTTCVYTNNANGKYAQCNVPINRHSWRHPGQYNPGFVCGKIYYKGELQMENQKGVLPVSYQTCADGATEVGFRTFFAEEDKLKLGATVGVVTRAKGVTAAHGSQYFKIEKTEGFMYVLMDVVDVSDFADVSMAAWVKVDSKGWDDSNQLKVWATDMKSRDDMQLIEAPSKLPQGKWLLLTAPLQNFRTTARMGFGVKSVSSDLSASFDMLRIIGIGDRNRTKLMCARHCPNGTQRSYTWGQAA